MRARCSISTRLCATIGLLGACTSSPTGPSERKAPVLPPAASLVLYVAPSVAIINGGQTVRLTARRQDGLGTSLPPTEVLWASSNPKVARIGTEGTVLGTGRGTVEITVNWHGMRGASRVIVLGNDPLTGPCAELAVAGLGTTVQRPSSCKST
jgi:Big-like domain-containing protein